MGFSLEFMLGEPRRKDVRRLGAGKIGRATARLAKLLRPAAVRQCGPLHELLEAADVVSLHVSLLRRRHLIDGAALARMRPSAVLVNTARGGRGETALVVALREGVIAGAALDVFEFEPRVSEELLGLENVVLSPHLGSATASTRNAMGMLAVDALRAVLLEDRRPANAL
jgi:lactate dehydrogenase-like 2-hydroxyacid dehydrogenase